MILYCFVNIFIKYYCLVMKYTFEQLNVGM